MTTPKERTRALHLTNCLLNQLTQHARTDIPQDLLALASIIQRHYPSDCDIRNIACDVQKGAMSNPLLEPIEQSELDTLVINNRKSLSSRP